MYNFVRPHRDAQKIDKYFKCLQRILLHTFNWYKDSEGIL